MTSSAAECALCGAVWLLDTETRLWRRARLQGRWRARSIAIGCAACWED